MLGECLLQRRVYDLFHGKTVQGEEVILLRIEGIGESAHGLVGFIDKYKLVVEKFEVQARALGEIERAGHVGGY